MTFSLSDLKKREAQTLKSYAVKSKDSLGRVYPEDSRGNRLCFQKDRDRIIHSRAFRRLEQKTQVFIAGSGDHYRTRLTHTLEVAQISRGISRQLGLNEDLAEAIALAHDLGHPPFGHGGEEALDRIMKKYGHNFEHNKQSRLVVEKLEHDVYPGFPGLNLSYEVLDGLIKHQSAWDQASTKFEVSAHLEAQIVNIADEIAYTNHDIDDGLRSGIIKLKDLDKFKVWQDAKKAVAKRYGELEGNVLVSRCVSELISIMIENLVGKTERNIAKYNIKTVDDVRNLKRPIADFCPSMKRKLADLRKFLYGHFYMTNKVQKFVREGERMIEKMFDYYMKRPGKMGTSRNKAGDDLAIVVKDYIAGMTDSYLKKEYDLSKVS